MVYHNQEGIKTGGWRKVSNEVTRDLLKWARCGRPNRGEQGNSGVHVRPVLLAGCTALDVLANIRGKAWPPELSGDKLTCL